MSSAMFETSSRQLFPTSFLTPICYYLYWLFSLNWWILPKLCKILWVLRGVWCLRMNLDFAQQTWKHFQDLWVFIISILTRLSLAKRSISRGEDLVFSMFWINTAKIPTFRGRPKNAWKRPQNRKFPNFREMHSARIMFYDPTDVRNRFFTIKLP